MAKKWTNPNTKKESTFLTFAEKIAKAKKELRGGYRMTNDGKEKLDNEGKRIELTEKQKAYRAGLIAADNEKRDIYFYNKAKAEGKLDEWKAKKKQFREELKKNKK